MKQMILKMMCILGSALFLFGAAAAEPTGDPLRVTFFDVGKGDCILVSRGGCSVMIDTGYAETADNVAAAMRQQGIDHLDALILTHYDRDHVGGIEAILRAFPAEHIYIPGYDGSDKIYTAAAYALQQSGLDTEKVTADVSFTLSEVRFTVFATSVAYIPGEGKEEGNDNDVSLVVSVRYGNDSFLLAGDIEKEGIDSFLAAGHGTYDVVKMPHHGQNEKNTDDFIARVGMKIAVITDGEEEPVKKKVMKLLTAAGAEVYTSAANGDITITGTGNGTYDVVTER